MIRQLHVVFGEWLLRDNSWDFGVDNTLANIMDKDDYNLDMNREVMDLIYLLLDEMMQQMPPDTLPIHVTSRIVGDANIDGNQDVDEVSDEEKVEEEVEEDYEYVNEVKNEREEDANFSDAAEVDDEFADYGVYGKVKDDDEDEEDADDICFEGFKETYASEGESSNWTFSNHIYVNQSFVSRDALVSELRLSAVKQKFSFKIYKASKTLLVLHVVFGEWLLRDNSWDFVVDKKFKGAIIFFFSSDASTHVKLVEMDKDDYNLDMNREVMDLIYLLLDEMMQQMPPDTLPIHVTSDRQVQNLIEISKTHAVHLCVSSRGRIVGDANIDGNQDAEDVDEVSDEEKVEEEVEEDYEDVNEVKNEREEDANFSDAAEVDDEFADYSVYGKVKDENEEDADDICFEGFKVTYASEG
ncbi:hypothetical protein F2Q69_00010887 [Brassica cretica]|uniref:Uncharacterized protein n=1 Tax=Brassica cretica TaxID=69181 RepID=A0A8S9R6I1_BRACR|nr:hypothetical protein F2Q69_00010887 [Brassica cretica]